MQAVMNVRILHPFYLLSISISFYTKEIPKRRIRTLAKRYKNTGTPPTKIAAGISPRYCWFSKRVDTIGGIDKGGCCDTLCSGAEMILKPGWPGKIFPTITTKIYY